MRREKQECSDDPAVKLGVNQASLQRSESLSSGRCHYAKGKHSDISSTMGAAELVFLGTHEVLMRSSSCNGEWD